MSEYEPTSQPTTPPAQEAPVSTAASIGRGIWELVQILVLALLMVMVIRNFIHNYRIDGISMEPNFHDGQFLIVNRFAYCPGVHLEIPVLNKSLFDKTWCVRAPSRGDVVIFEYPRDPSRDFIKRVIGLPGETVEVIAGQVYVNGQLMPEPFGPNPGSYNAAPLTVGPDEVYVMGDNRNNSSDSHLWGPLKLENIIGKALISYWPPSDWAVVPQYNLTDLSAAQ
ncbi:MAG: signal peptidase I [Anaerolineae bacterium]|nr:signal peptidase I [Anaerolineae bacterium]